jgi:hypothetical protein
MDGAALGEAVGVIDGIRLGEEVELGTAEGADDMDGAALAEAFGVIDGEGERGAMLGVLVDVGKGEGVRVRIGDRDGEWVGVADMLGLVPRVGDGDGL